MFGKSRWVEHYEVVEILCVVKEFECVFTISLMSLIAREVEFHVGVGQVYCLGAAVNGVYEVCSSSHGIEGEASCVAEHVEHVLSLCVFLKQTAVLSLVNEESCLLSFQPVYMEFQSVFHSRVVGTASDDEAVFLSEVCLVG